MKYQVNTVAQRDQLPNFTTIVCNVYQEWYKGNFMLKSLPREAQNYNGCVSLASPGVSQL